MNVPAKLPPELADADTVGVIYDETDGLNFHNEYGMPRGCSAAGARTWSGPGTVSDTWGTEGQLLGADLVGVTVSRYVRKTPR